MNGRRRRWAIAAGTVLAMRAAVAPAWSQDASSGASSGASAGASAGASSGAGAGAPSGSSAGLLASSPLTAVLPSAGLTAPTGGLREQLDREAPGGGPSYQPGLIITPSIGVDVGATDNPGGLYGASGTSQTHPDAFTVITPGVAVSGQTSRVQVNAGYFPSITRYLQTSSQNSVDQSLYGNARITVVPDAVYISATGSITDQSQTGGTFSNSNPQYGTGGNVTSVNSRALAETYNFSVTPYAVHRFGDIGSAQIGYTFAYTSNTGISNTGISNTGISNTGLSNTGANTFTGSSLTDRFGIEQPLVTNREFASFSTGEDLGRFNSTSTVQATQFSGTGVYANNSRRNLLSEDLTYAVTRLIAVLGRFGFEDVRYGGTPGTRIDDPIWRAGVQITPNDSSRLLLAYGHSDGFDSAYVAGTYTPTARTRLDVSYSAGLATDLEDIQNTSILTTYDGAGTTFNQLTGGPIGTTDSFYGIDNNLFRLRRFALTGTLLYERDTYSLTAADERRTIVSVANASNTALLGSKDGGPSATVTWEHQLSPVLTSSVSGSVGTDTITGQGGGRQVTYAAFAGLFWQLSPTLTASARYTFQRNSGSQSASSGFNNGFESRAGTVNTLLFGVRKSF